MQRPWTTREDGHRIEGDKSLTKDVQASKISPFYVCNVVFRKRIAVGSMSGSEFAAAIVLAFSAVTCPATAMAQTWGTRSSPEEVRITRPRPSPDADGFRVRVISIAGHLTHFATRAIVTNRPLRTIEFPANVTAEQEQLVADLQNLGHDPDELHRLLNDPNPRVRTIALGALFARENPQDLPYIAKLIDDRVTTLPDLHESMNATRRIPPVLSDETEGPQTVGQVASAMIQFYIEAAHVEEAVRANGYPIPEPELSLAFDRYWAERKDLTHCASWFLVKLERATRETLPLQSRYRADVSGALAQIRELPAPERDWTLLFAAYGEHLPSEQYVGDDAEFLRAAQEIGPDSLMKFLLREPFSSDPDLDVGASSPSASVHFFVPVSRFILTHATALLRPRDARALLEDGAARYLNLRISESTEWVKAAVTLLGGRDPQEAARWMEADLRNTTACTNIDLYRRVVVASALWLMRGPTENGLLVQWFYSLPDPARNHYAGDFLSTVEELERNDTPELVKAIASDSRLDTTDYYVLVALLRSAIARDAAPLINRQEIQKYNPGSAGFTSFDNVYVSWRSKLRSQFDLPESNPSSASRNHASPYRVICRCDRTGYVSTLKSQAKIVVREVRTESVAPRGPIPISVLVLFEPKSGAYSWEVNRADEADPSARISEFNGEHTAFLKDGEIILLRPAWYSLFVHAIPYRASSLDDAEAKSMKAIRESVSSVDELLEGQNTRKVSLSPLAPDFLNRSTGSMLDSERPKVTNVRWEGGNWLITLQGQWTALVTLDSDLNPISMSKVQ